MVQFAFIDKTVRPDTTLLRSALGDKSVFWDELMEYVHRTSPGITEEWKFYNDGKCWLFRLLRKKATIAWIGVMQGSFRVTVYVGSKADPLIAASGLPKKLKDEFAAHAGGGPIRSISILMKKPADVKTAEKLIDLKLRMK